MPGGCSRSRGSGSCGPIQGLQSDVQGPRPLPGHGRGHGPCSSWRYSGTVFGGALPPLCVLKREKDGLWGRRLCQAAEQGGHQPPVLGFGFFSPFPPPWPGLHSLPVLSPKTPLHREQQEITVRKERPGNVSGAGPRDVRRDGEGVPMCTTRAVGVPLPSAGRPSPQVWGTKAGTGDS